MVKQRGFVSIIVAAILMILLSLVVLGLSTIMQREQRQSIDRQLSTQAFYAAETGVNDVQKEILAGSTVAEKTDCDPSSGGFNGVIDPAEPDVEYTCLLIDPTPQSLEYDNGAISTQTSKVIPLNAESGNFGSITFEWSGNNGNTLSSSACSSVADDLPASRPNDVPILRVDLTPLGGAGAFERANLISNTATVFLYPTSGSSASCQSSSDISALTKGEVVHVPCGSTLPACSFTITGGSLSNSLIARVKAIYSEANLTVTGLSGGSPVSFVGAQTEVDATGRANDVLRRIKVRLASTTAYPYPEYILQAFDGVCKQIAYAPPDTVAYPCPN